MFHPGLGPGLLGLIRKPIFLGLASLMGLSPLVSEEVLELGPFRTREMFPLYLNPMAYQPTDPTPLGEGRWRVDVDHIQANTFEFSDVFKDILPRDGQGRISMSRAWVEAHASAFASLPVVFFFDEEVARTSLRIRRGMTENLEIWAEVAFQSHGGGYLDGTIESFHSLGFEQFGRDLVARNQVTVMVMEYGQVRFYSDDHIRGKTQDPVLGTTLRLYQGQQWTVSAVASVKPPITEAYGLYRSGWDHSFSVSSRWQPSSNHVFYGGTGYVRRPRGNGAYNAFPLCHFRDGVGAHATWEYRRNRKLRPFIQLYYQTGYLPAQPSQSLDQGSLQHDLGIHWQVARKTVLTFRYLNNITHNANTADMGLGLSLSTLF